MDRKALQRAYKETKHPIGVYRIRNKVNGKTIVGTSVNLPAILNRHRAGLRMGGHEIRELQKDWNEHGADAFEFEILDQLTPKDEPGYDPANDLKELEQLWLEKLGPLTLYR